MEEMQESLL